jgi:uncharacterized Zn-finger protein
MPTYTCNVCHFSSKIKCNYLAHLKTKKHLKNVKELDKRQTYSEPEKPKSRNKIKTPKINSSLPNFNSFNTEDLIRKLQNLDVTNHYFNPEAYKILECEYCGKSFSRPDNLKRHQDHRCLDRKKIMEESFFKDLYEKEVKERENVKEEHQRQLEIILDKVGTTNITNTNCGNTQTNNQTNVQLNNFGSENLDMLTDKYMRRMIIYPYSAIPKMIKKIHFNDKFPENQNIRMLNKKDNKLQIRNNNKWEYVNKKEALESLISDKNYQLDKYYEENRETFESQYQMRFDNFQDKLEENDKCVAEDINTDTELVFWNSM